MTHRDDFSDLIAEAEAYCAPRGWKLSTLGAYAVGNSKWFDDRKAGKPCLTRTVERVRRYMEDAVEQKETGAA